MAKAKNLKYYRTKAGLTQEQFAEAFGVSRTTVINWENAKTSIPAPATARIAEFFNIPVSEFRDADQEMMEAMVGHQTIRLTESEAQNILMFRELPEDIKSLIRYAIVVAHKNITKGANYGRTKTK